MKYQINLPSILLAPEPGDHLSEEAMTNVLLYALAERVEKLVEGMAYLNRYVNQIQGELKRR